MLRILIVEDNKFFRESFKKRLEDQFKSIFVEEASNSEETFQKIDGAPPHLIFIDIRLPGMNGLDLTKKIKKDFPGIRIAILTEYDLPEYREAANRYGADRFFVKSAFNWDEMEAFVKSIQLEL